jgi:predicted extracellular nuclease
MSIYNFRRMRTVAAGVVTALVVLCGAGVAQPSNHIVISQVYGGGGNSGATLTNDFIEVFNPTPTATSVAGYSVQYASSTGSSWQVTSLPSVTLQPGQYLLVQESQGAGGTTALPTPDATGTIALSATAGKVALVSATTALSGTCPTTNVVDLVGFGTAANCSETAPTATLSNTTAALRTNACTDSDNNSTDFSVGAPNPRNTSSTFLTCNQTGPGPISAAGLAVPATVNLGDASLLTVKVTPGTNPASTGVTVTADLSAIGGSSTQPLFDDGSNGDVTAGDNTFSYLAVSTTSGSFSLPATAMDSQARTGTTTIALSVVVPPPTETIQAIQATKPSAFAGKVVTTSGIVVGVKSNGFYIEAKDATTNPATPQGVLVYTGSTTKPAYIVLGNEVQVTGLVATYPPTALTPGTEIDGPQTFRLLNSNLPLPAPVTITAAMDSPSGGVYQFARLEGSRVAIDSLTTTSGTGASLNESTETNTSNGLFYGVVTGVARPFREPGVAVTDTLFGPLPAGVPVWDSNPELLYIDSKSFGRAAIDLTSNSTVTGLAGVMDFSSGTPEIILDATNHPTVTGGMTVVPVPVEASNEFTIASFNMERFYNDKADADNPGSSAVTVTTEAYQRRLAKASLAIRNVLNTPDVIGTQEIENLAVLTDLAAKVSTDAVAAGQADPLYQPYLFLANDGTAINTGFLVKSTRVNTLKVEQLGLTTTFTNSVGNQAILNDRTPLVLHAGIKRGTAADYPVTVISVHQRSLINVDDPTSTGATVRLKREAQAEYLANLIQGYQAAGEHVVTVGDYNGFEFSDGFVDVLGVTKGTPVPASQVVTPPVAGLANPPLVDLVTLLPADQRQSYVETGSAQVLDHVLVTQDLVPTNTRLVYAHIDSDWPLVLLNDATSPNRISDHDPAVAYFTIPPVQGSLQLITTSTLTLLNDGSYQATVTVKNNGTGTAQGVKLTGAVLGSANGSPLPAALGDIQPGASASTTIVFPASAGAPGTATAERFSGIYTGGSFSGAIRATLPSPK